jgi:hypothetical protein
MSNYSRTFDLFVGFHDPIILYYGIFLLVVVLLLLPIPILSPFSAALVRLEPLLLFSYL